jgi:hypothetical protein
MLDLVTIGRVYRVGSGSVRLAEEKEPLIHAAFGPQISADQRNNVSVNQRFLLPVKIA